MPDLPKLPRDPGQLADFVDQLGRDRLPGTLGIEIVELEAARCRLRLDITSRHLASNGYLHAGTVVTVADTAAGYGCMASLPTNAAGFTTIELKCNFLGTALNGGLAAEASLVHKGQTTQVWDASVTREADGRTVGLFRCTQMILRA